MITLSHRLLGAAQSGAFRPLLPQHQEDAGTPLHRLHLLRPPSRPAAFTPPRMLLVSACWECGVPGVCWLDGWILCGVPHDVDNQPLIHSHFSVYYLFPYLRQFYCVIENQIAVAFLYTFCLR